MRDRNFAFPGVRWSTDWPIVLSATLVLVFVIALILAPILLSAERNRVEDRMAGLERIDQHLDEVESSASGATAAYRGFLLTNDSSFLVRAVRATGRLEVALIGMAEVEPGVSEDIRDALAELEVAIDVWNSRLIDYDLTEVKRNQLAYEGVQRAISAVSRELNEGLESLAYDIRRLERWWGVAQAGLASLAAIAVGTAFWGAHQLRYHRHRGV